MICNEIVKNQNFWPKHLKSNEHIGALKYLKEYREKGETNKIQSKQQEKFEKPMSIKEKEDLNTQESNNQNLEPNKSKQSKANKDQKNCNWTALLIIRLSICMARKDLR